MEIRGTVTWRRRKWEHPAVQDLDKCTLVGGYLYLYGGRETTRPKFYVYSLKDDSWRTIKGNISRQGHEAVLVDDKLFLVGGFLFRKHRFWFAVCKTIEAYDLLLGSTETVCSQIECNGKTVFIERRRELCIVKNGSVTLVDVDNFTFGDVKLKGIPLSYNYVSLVESGGSVFVYMTSDARHSTLGVLTFHAGYNATFSAILTGSMLKRRSGLQIQMVNGLLLGFGGKFVGVGCEDVFVFDPRTREYVEGDPRQSRSFKCVGMSPPAAFERSVSFNGRLLLLGGKKFPSLVELEFTATGP